MVQGHIVRSNTWQSHEISLGFHKICSYGSCIFIFTIKGNLQVPEFQVALCFREGDSLPKHPGKLIELAGNGFNFPLLTNTFGFSEQTIMNSHYISLYHILHPIFTYFNSNIIFKYQNHISTICFSSHHSDVPDIFCGCNNTRRVTFKVHTTPRGQLMTPDGRQKWDPLRCRVDERQIHFDFRMLGRRMYRYDIYIYYIYLNICICLFTFMYILHTQYVLLWMMYSYIFHLHTYMYVLVYRMSSDIIQPQTQQMVVHAWQGEI